MGGREVFQVGRTAGTKIWGQNTLAGAVDMMRLSTDQMKMDQGKIWVWYQVAREGGNVQTRGERNPGSGYCGQI